MKSIYFFLLTSLLFTLITCKKLDYSDLYPEAEIEVDQTSIKADGFSTVTGIINFGERLPKDQPVTLSISNGSLYIAPFNTNEVGQDSITVSPFDEELRFMIKSNTKTDDNVIVSCAINTHIIDTQLAFTEAFPEDVMLSSTDYALDSGETATLTAEFYNNDGVSSDGIRYFVNHTIEVQDTSLASIVLDYPEYVISDSNKISFEVGARIHSDSTAVRFQLTGSSMDGSSSIEKSVLIWFE